MMKNLKGFTLIELMIVMVIITILIGLLLPGALQMRGKGVEVQCQSRLRQCGLALYAYAKDNDGTLPTNTAWTTALTGGGYLDADTVTKCPKTKAPYKAQWAGAANLYNMTASTKLLECLDGTGPHNISVYADGHVK